MKIETDFPYKHCEDCPECMIDVEDHSIWVNGDTFARVITVRCRNDSICKQVEKGIRDHVERGKPM